MNRIWPMAMFAAACLTATAAQKNPFAGRWDIDVKTPNGTYPDWMELTEKNGTTEVRIQPRGGAVHPAAAVKIDGKRLLVTVSEAAANRPAVTWELTADGDQLTGTQRRGDASDALSGVRAPVLKRATPKAWTAAEPIFNGKDLAGWEPVNNPANSHWTVKDGELVNEARGSNIKTTRTFNDFKLHIEVNCPDHCNSGIYLRGRYEIQVGTEGGKLPSHEMGAVYGYVAPAKEMPMGNGEWQKFDITLVGRYVTVVRNGVVIHNRQEIPGITGGALDSREGEPGPFFLQGDHTGGLRYRNITVSVPKK